MRWQQREIASARSKVKGADVGIGSRVMWHAARLTNVSKIVAHLLLYFQLSLGSLGRMRCLFIIYNM